MSFCTETWERHRRLYEAVRDMPFNRALADGTLPQAAFQHYMIQDAHYLVAYGRVLALAAAKADQSASIVQFAEAAREAIVVERSLHEGFLDQFGIDRTALSALPMSPACHHYTCYLQSIAWSAPYPVVLAALLPCFWLYAEVGKHIHAISAPGNRYQPWVDTYAGEAFHAVVEQVKKTIDHVAEGADEALREQMHLAFAAAARLEWMFWDAAWRDEGWPV